MPHERVGKKRDRAFGENLARGRKWGNSEYVGKRTAYDGRFFRQQIKRFWGRREKQRDWKEKKEKRFEGNTEKSGQTKEKKENRDYYRRFSTAMTY